MKNLLDFMKNQNTRYFVNSSILLITDNVNKSYKFKLIDMNYVGSDPEVI